MVINWILLQKKGKTMKKILLYLMLLLPGFLLSSCETYELGNPQASTVADFSYTVSNDGYVPCEVTFTNKSLNASGYLWNFGNGQTSTDPSPVITYDAPGLYTVTLTCTAESSVYYNKLVKTLVINIKDPLAGLTQVLYYTSRGPEGGGVHMVYLTDGAPQVADFEQVEFSRAYGIAVDTANSKVYVSDYSLGYIYRFDADGKNPVRILDVNVPGQEIVDSPEALMVVGDKLYWGRPGGIYRCNLDGSNPEVFISTEGTRPEYPIDMQYDEATGKIYLVNDRTDYTGGYFSVNFDGTGWTEHIVEIDGTAIEVDTETNKTYMAVYGVAGTTITENGIYICNTDGSNLSKIGDFGSKATWGIAIDHERDKLFWGYKISNSAPDGKIIRSNPDGSGQEDWLTGVSPHAMQIVWIKL
jgi:PKD repeat protein